MGNGADGLEMASRVGRDLEALAAEFKALSSEVKCLALQVKAFHEKVENNAKPATEVKATKPVVKPVAIDKPVVRPLDAAEKPVTGDGK